MSSVVDFVPEAYVGAFPPFEPDRFKSLGRNCTKGENKSEGVDRVLSSCLVCVSLSALTDSMRALMNG